MHYKKNGVYFLHALTHYSNLNDYNLRNVLAHCINSVE